jgi:hypothetical protein
MDRTFSKLITAREVKSIGTEEIHREYFRQLLRSEYANSRCTTGAYTKYADRKFVKYPKPPKHWGIGAIFDGDRAKYKLFCDTVKSGARVRFRGEIPHWAIANMIETEWGVRANVAA